MGETILFPGSGTGVDELLVGPFEEYRVVVEGRVIPRLTGWREGGNVALCVDRRFSISVPAARAYDVAWIIAHALAVGAGYSDLGAATKDRPFATVAHRIGEPG